MFKINIEIGKFKIHKDSYNIKPIFKRWSIYPVLIMSLLYIVFQFMMLRHNYSILPYQKVFKSVLILSYLILGFDVLLKKEHYKQFFISIVSILCGSYLNSLVIHKNNNKMPIFPALSYVSGYTQYNMITHASQYGDFHVLGDHLTNFIYLADIFDFGVSIWSIGDILFRVFAFIIVYNSIKVVNE